MKLFTSILTIASLFSTVAMATIAREDAQARYQHLASPELSVELSHDGSPLAGLGIAQKNDINDMNGNFCRKLTVIAPPFKSSYVCYGEVMNADDAKAYYTSSKIEEANATFFSGGQPLAGSGWSEKEVSVPQYGSEPLLCVRREAVVPNAVPDYACYYANRSPSRL